MKRFMMTVVLGLLISTISNKISAQENTDYTIQGELVKYVRYFDNGQVQEKGFYDKDKKLTGRWVQYNENGEKLAIAHYEKGNKVGKWFFWKDNTLFEIDYKNYQVAQVKSWSNYTVVTKD